MAWNNFNNLNLSMGCGIIYKNLRDRMDLKELFIDPNYIHTEEKYVPIMTQEG